MAILAINSLSGRGPMRTVSAKDAKYNFGELIDTARTGPVTVVKYGRPVVVVMAVEEYRRLKGLDPIDPPPTGRDKNRGLGES
jgi:prevent-host-death family protein